MNLLYDRLPNEYNGLKVNTDFRNFIKFELLMQDREIAEKEKILASIILLFKNEEGNLEKALSNPEKAIETILWFYRCGKSEEKENISGSNSHKQIYSFEYDNDYIYSAFYEQYKINLATKKMHWFEFRALFQGLNENVQFSKIMGYRSINIFKIKDKDEQNRYAKLKALYQLPDMRTIEEKESDFANAFC